MTIRFLADENIDADIVSGLRRRDESVDIVRVQDVGLRSRDDPTILTWAAENGRLLVSHDIKTIPTFAYQRVTAGLPMPGVLILRRRVPTAVALDELALIAGASEPEQWANRVVHLPLR